MSVFVIKFGLTAARLSAVQVLDMVKQMNAQVAEEKAKDDGGDGRGGSGDGANASRGGADVSEIDTLVLVDRTVDWISPLVCDRCFLQRWSPRKRM